MKTNKVLLNIVSVFCFIFGAFYIFSLVFIPVGIYCFAAGKLFSHKADHLLDNFVADKKIMKRSYLKTVSILGVNYLFFSCVVLISHFFKPSISSYGEFLIWGVGLLFVFSILGLGLNFIVNRECWKMIKRYFLLKRQ